MSNVTVAILAGGPGRRFEGGGHKLDAFIDGRSVADWAIASAVDSGVGEVVVITGATEPEAAVRAAAWGQVSLVANPDWASGQATSLALAVIEADRRNSDALLVGLADQPAISPAAWILVARSQAMIAQATYNDRPGHPVRLARTVWPLLPVIGDEGARSVIRLHPELVEPVPCPGSSADIDTREDLRLWQGNSSTSSW